MNNNEEYRNISVKSLDISSRIKHWAEENHIETLYDLIESMNSFHKNKINNVTDQEIDDWTNDNIIILNDENGNEVKFEFLDLINYESEEYVVLLPVSDNDSDDAGEVVILRVVDESGEGENEEYVSVDTEETLNKVFEIFKNKNKDEFDFV